jgi:hypothetical protein
MKVKLYCAIIIVACVLLPFILLSQPPGGPIDPDTPSTPIDGGVSVLIAAGVGYGLKKVKEARSKERKNDK